MSQTEELPTAQLATDLVNKITLLLSENQLKEAISAINDNKYTACLKENSWDLIPVITKHLNDDTNNTQPELFDCCEKLLLVVAEKSNPEEALLEFIEQAELAKEDIKFLAILKSLQKTLLKLTSKRGRSLEWTFNTIQGHINELPETGEYSYENDEKVLQDVDDSVQRITFFYLELLPFYKPFIDEISTNTLTTELKQRRDLIACFMLQLLGRPLACLDMECGVKAKSRARLCAEKIMEYLSVLVSDCFKFLKYINERRKQPLNDKNGVMEEAILDVFACDEKAPMLSLGVYYYLILSENIQYRKTPMVYEPLYVFQSVFHVVAGLLSHSEQFVTRKGLLLAHALICSEMINVFPADVLDSPAHCNFCKNLTNIVIYSDVKEYRQLGIKIFKTYIFKFDLKGRYLLIENLMNTVKHINTRAYLVSQYKDMIREVFSIDENKISEYFSGKKLFKMLNVFCYLPEGQESDLMELGDQFITTINLLIYLTIRDKYNATGIWNYFDSIDKTFFVPLKEGLIISKAHYELKMKELKNEKGQGDSTDSKFSVSIKGHSLPGMSKEEQKSVLQAALNSFEALEMLLARLKELIDEGPAINI